MTFSKIVIFTIVLLITACNDHGMCGDLSSYPKEFDITDVSIQVLVAPELEGHPTPAVGEKYTENTEVKYNEIIFSINSETQIIAKKSEKSKSFSFSLFSSAYACSLAPPSTSEQIIDIKVTSSADFNGSLTAGDSLKSKFDVVYADSETNFHDYNYTSGVATYFSLNKYLEQDEVYGGNIIQLKLNEAPEFAGSHIFFIEFILNTGELFALETTEISFTNL